MSKVQGWTLGFVVLVALASSVEAQPVGPEFQVNTQTSGRQYFASVASDASGNFVVVWYGATDGNLFGVFAQRYDNAGAPDGSEFQVNTYTTSYQGAPVVASEPSGAFVVAWDSKDSVQEGSGNPGVFGQRYDLAGNTVGSEFHINTHTTNKQVSPVIAVDPNGDFVVVWNSLDQDLSGYGVFGQRFNAAGDTLGGEFPVNTYTTGQQSNPSVTWLASGDFIVVWTGDDAVSSRGVFGQRYASSGSPAGGEFQVNTETLGSQDYPDVAADANGNFVVVWGGEDGDDRGIFGQRFDSAGDTVGGEFPINAHTTGVQQHPSVASDARGNFAVVWTDRSGQDGDVRGVFGRRFDASGNPLGGEFQVNTYTSGIQRFRPGEAVSSDPIGNLVVVWEDDGGHDGSEYGVFGQRYAALVAIDIKPGTFPNSINLRKKGLIPVAILTTPTFDATTVDVSSVQFGASGTEAAAQQSAQQDVDFDGDTDLILHFRTEATGILCGATSASLTGQTGGGQAIQDSDSIVTVGCK